MSCWLVKNRCVSIEVAVLCVDEDHFRRLLGIGRQGSLNGRAKSGHRQQSSLPEDEGQELGGIGVIADDQRLYKPGSDAFSSHSYTYWRNYSVYCNSIRNSSAYWSTYCISSHPCYCLSSTKETIVIDLP